MQITDSIVAITGAAGVWAAPRRNIWRAAGHVWRWWT